MFKQLIRTAFEQHIELIMGEGGEVVEVSGRGGGQRGSHGRPPLPTNFVEQIAFQEIEEKEVIFQI